MPAFGTPPGVLPQGSFPAPAAAPLREPFEQGAPRGRSARERAAILVSLVLAVLLVAGSGATAWYLTADEAPAGPAAGRTAEADAKPASVKGGQLIGTRQPDLGGDSTLGAHGLWVTERIVAKGEPYAVAGYDSVSGAEKWRLKLPGEICAAAPHASADGRTAVAFRERRPKHKSDYPPCSQVALIDLGTGRKLWQDAGTDGDQPLNLDQVTVGGGAVAAGGTGGAIAWRLSGGEPLWQSQPGANCSEDGFAGGAALIAVVRCGDYSKPQLRVEKVDINTKQPVWSYRLPNGTRYAQVLSTEPTVIGLTLGEASRTTDLLSLDGQGRLRARISLGTAAHSSDATQYEPHCSFDPIESCRTFAVDDSHVYLPSAEHNSPTGDGRTNEIVAFDLGTGRAGAKYDAGNGRTILPLRTAGGKLLAYLTPTYKESGSVVAIDTTDGSREVWLRLPDSQKDIANQLSPERDQAIFAYGRLYMGSSRISTRSYSGPERYLLLAYGSD
ncbi:PQQ-binding-like beta-propeller repeat protein [Streptomyces polyrhachis]|uniref:PQQ-binding-like beta-propeller repeat protein n=1 Tax=Streptomyces polyrhachis TaxID=1282885 RepID=A0ABW2GMY2_9ACTN